VHPQVKTSAVPTAEIAAGPGRPMMLTGPLEHQPPVDAECGGIERLIQAETSIILDIGEQNECSQNFHMSSDMIMEVSY